MASEAKTKWPLGVLDDFKTSLKVADCVRPRCTSKVETIPKLYWIQGKIPPGPSAAPRPCFRTGSCMVVFAGIVLIFRELKFVQVIGPG